MKREDLIGSLDPSAGASGEIVTDSDGYEAFIPASLEEQEKIERYLSEEHTFCLQDYKPVWDQALANRRAFKAMGDDDKLITLPICKRDALQQISWTYNQITKKTPMVSVIPDEPGEMEVFEHGPAGPIVKKVTTEDEARDLEQWLEWKNRKHLNFKRNIYTTLMDMFVGEAPVWWKVTWDRQHITTKKRQITFKKDASGIILQKDGRPITDFEIVDAKVLKSAGAKVEVIPVYNLMMPADWMDPEAAPVLFERKPMTSDELRKAIGNGELNLAPTDSEELESLFAMTTNTYSNTSDKQLGEISGRVASSPTNRHDTWCGYFYFPAIVEQQVETGEVDEMLQPVFETKQVVKVLSLYGIYHATARKLLSCHLTPYWMRNRPFFPFTQREDTHQLSSESVVQDITPHQKLASWILQSQMANAAIANQMSFLVRKGTSAWSWFTQNGGKFKPGSYIPVDGPDDVKPFLAGAQFRSMFDELGFITTESAKTSGVNDYDRNMVNLSRTTAAAMAMAQEAGKQQPMMVLDRFRDRVGEAYTFILQITQQFAPYGERIPYRDEVKRQVIEKWIRMPKDVVLAQFGFTITASGEEQSQEAEFEKTLMLYNETLKRGPIAAAQIAQIVQPGNPPALRKLQTQMYRREEEMFTRLMSFGRQDADALTVGENDITQAIAELEQWAAMQQQQQMAAGGMDGGGVQAPGAGGPVPGEEGIGGGMALPPELGGMAGGGPGDQAPPIP